MIEFIFEIKLGTKRSEGSFEFKKEPEFVCNYENEKIKFLAWGDPIITDNFYDKLFKNPTSGFIINHIAGHYYYLFINKDNNELIFGNSLFSLLPVYYSYDNSRIIFSENALNLGEYVGINKISRRFILETILFNYPVYNNSILENINLLPANSYFFASGDTFNICNHTKIADFFTEAPIPNNNSLEYLTDIFLKQVEKYLPDTPYVHALTGGFDGRALVSAGLFHKKRFSCYSFGTESAKDTSIANKLSKSAGIPYINIKLDDEYIKQESLKNGLEFIHGASGMGTFARAHYLYAAKKLASQSNYLLTGNFGSEIFRAVHNPGVVFSSNLIDLFESSNLKKSIKHIENSNEFLVINKNNFLQEWDDLKEELKLLPCFDNKYAHLTQNQQFYIFIFEEVFRKYFGAEMVNQFPYVKNRTPFLDPEFLKSILGTKFAGIHSDFFENNPFKRYKGQVLYAHIIKKAYPVFGSILTDKGYRPNDLINIVGNLNIIYGYIRKKLNKYRKTIENSDPYSVNNSYLTNKEFFSKVTIDSALFDAKNNVNQDLEYKLLSLSYLKNKYNLQ